MNAQRRKQLNDVLTTIADARAALESLRDEEQDSYDNMPEAFQDGERGEKAQAAIDALEEAIDALDQADTAIEEAQQQ